MTQTARRAADDHAVEPVRVSYSLATPLHQLPAHTLFHTGGDVLDLLNRLATVGQRDRRLRKIQWRAEETAGGRAVLLPISEPDLAANAAASLVEGLALAEREVSLHRAWDIPTANIAERLTRRLGDNAGSGLAMTASAAGAGSLDAIVTRKASQHLHDATKLTITSYGSAIGVLGRVSVKPYRRASLWSDLDGRRVDVHFRQGDEDAVRAAWAREQVEVVGVVHENSAGQLLRVDMDKLVVHEPSGLRWTDLRRGSAPDLTGGLDTLTFLDVIRGEDR